MPANDTSMAFLAQCVEQALSQHMSHFRISREEALEDLQCLVNPGVRQVFGLPRSRDEKKRKAVSQRIARQVYERDEYRCRQCGTFLNLTVDHIVPVARGGITALENLQTLCGPCNGSKGVR
jgi:hypothetical protein